MKYIRLSLLTIVCLMLKAVAVSASPDDTLRDTYRHFIMPTAKAVEGGYVGTWELAFLQAGFGADVFSFAGGITALPTVAFRSQIAFLQGKVTLLDDPSGLSFAAGLNFLRMTSTYPYYHLFAVGTYETPEHTRFTGLFMFKISGDDFPIVNIAPYGSFAFTYGGATGGGIGFDTPLAGEKNVRVFAELWNHDIQSPTKLAGILGLRVESERFSSDFGIMYFTLPLIAPVANFVYRF